MSKALVIVGSAVMAAALSISMTPAHAGKKGGKGGIHIHIGGGKHHGFRPRRREVFYTPPQPRKVVTPVVRERVVVVRYEDGAGRAYDVASKVWHDGQTRCWSGKLAWTFKSNAWSYGSYSWSQAGGTWISNAPEAPAEVDCASVPAFASKAAPTVSQAGGGQPEMMGNPEESPALKPVTPKVAGPADGVAGPAGDCRKYVASLGEMVTVPCTL